MAAETVAALAAPIINAQGLHYKNPRLPLTIKLPDTLECGTKIYVHGAVANDAEKFKVNLENAEKDANTFFHFNPRFNEGCVIRNSRLDEDWGDEEKEGGNPFVLGEPFLLSIVANEDGFEVEVNGNSFCTYSHRDGMPFCEVTHITVGGDVTVYGVHIPLPSMAIPLVLRVPKNTVHGDMIMIKGKVPEDAERFTVNLQCGAADDADIMYHFNPCFPEDTLVCNKRISNVWEEQQSHDGLPMGSNDEFMLCILAAKGEPDGYMPIVNNERTFSLFPHSYESTPACTIHIDGNIEVFDLTVDCPPVRLPPHVPDINEEEFGDKTVQAHCPKTPVTMKLPDGFGPGKMVYVTGKIHGSPPRFKVNLQCGESENSGIALHFNPRWDSDGNPVLVLNSKDGDWGEEIHENFTGSHFLAPEAEVQLYFLCTDDGYRVLLDGNVAVDCFLHRLDCSRVNHVSVDGSITVFRVMAV